MKVKHYELMQIAEQFLKQYEMELTIPVEFNTRLKKVFGRFVYNNKRGERKPLKIEMSVDFLLSHPKEHIIDVFKHELVHYALFCKGLPHSDGQWTFENELRKNGVNSTHHYQYLGELHRYICINCNKTFDRKRKLVKTAFCNCSKGPNLEYKGIVVKEHDNMVAFQGDENNGHSSSNS